MGSINLSITLDNAVLEKVEKVRGDVSRSRFIQRALENALKKEAKKQ